MAIRRSIRRRSTSTHSAAPPFIVIARGWAPPMPPNPAVTTSRPRREPPNRYRASAAHVIATELVCACQGLEFHRPLRTTPALERAVEDVRALVPRLVEDRSMAEELDRLAEALRTGDLTLADTEVAV